MKAMMNKMADWISEALWKLMTNDPQQIKAVMAKINASHEPKPLAEQPVTWASRTSSHEYPPEVSIVIEAIETRLKWPSMHWGVEDVHSDAWPHVAAAALDAIRPTVHETDAMVMQAIFRRIQLIHRQSGNAPEFAVPVCHNDGHPLPCPTLRALDMGRSHD